MNKIPLIENACKDLLQYGVFDAKARAKYLIKRYLLGRRVAGEDLIFWPTGLLAAGLWHCRQELLEKEDDVGRTIGMIDQALTSYYERWLQKGMPLVFLDDLLAGETLLRIYEKMNKGTSAFGGKLSGERVKAALDKMAAFALEHPKDVAGSFFYRPANGEKTVFVDGIGLAVPFLYQYGEVFGKQEYQELALKQITNFLAYGMDGETGLPYHGYDLSDGGCKYGVIGWGRAVGWLLRGMTGCMTSDYGRRQLEAPCRALVEAVVPYRRIDGFSWQLQALEGPADTSATAIICAAIMRGMACGGLSGEACEKTVAVGREVLAHFTKDGRIWHGLAECEGFSCYPQRYGAYPWSLGPALEVL